MVLAALGALAVRHYLAVPDIQLVLEGRMALGHPEVLEHRLVLEVLEVVADLEVVLVEMSILTETVAVDRLVSQGSWL